MTENSEFHPVANVWPLLNDAELRSLADDIAAKGLLYPIWRHADGRIIDGRNRWLACRMVSPEFVCPSNTYTGEDGRELVEFVVSMNDKRRHMNEGQRAMVADKIANLPAHRPTADKSANLPTSQPVAVSQPEAAALLKVSERTVRDARVVRTKGVPELVRAVEQGEVAVNTAALIARDAAPAEQQKLVASGKKAMTEAAKQKKAERKASAQRRPRSPNRVLSVVEQQPEHLRFLALWLRNGAKMVTEFAGPKDAIDLADRYHLFINPAETRIILEFLTPLYAEISVEEDAA